MKELVFNILLLIIFTILLIKSADLLEDAFVSFSHKLRLNPFLIGFVILAIVSSLPEVSVAVNSAIQEVPGLSIGNLIGATIVLLSLVIGLNAVKHKVLPFKGSYSFIYLLASLALMSSMVVVMADRELSFGDGLMLIGGYGVITLMIVKKLASEHRTRYKEKTPVSKIILYCILGLSGLIIFSNLLVDRAVNIASFMGVPNSIIGLLMLGIGTNLPEITLLLRSNGAEKEKLAVGNFLGSASFNVAALGLLAVLYPHKVNNFEALMPAMTVLILNIIIFALVAFTGRQITKREGFILIAIYFIWVISEVAFSINKY